MTDAQLFREMYQEFYPRVLAYATSMVGRQTGEDITSETFTVAWQRWGDLPPARLPYLLGVARNLIRELRRRDARQYELALAEGRRVSTRVADLAAEVAERTSLLRAPTARPPVRSGIRLTPVARPAIMASSDGDGDVVLTNGDEGAQPSFGEVLAETRGALERFERMRAQAEQVSVTATSADGYVTVTVNSGGVPTGLRITDKALSLTGAQLADQVMATMRRAQAQLANRMNEVMQAIMGQDKETADRVLAVYHDRFPEPEPDQPPESETRFGEAVDEQPPPTQHRPRPPADEDDGWEGGGSFMKRS